LSPFDCREQEQQELAKQEFIERQRQAMRNRDRVRNFSNATLSEATLQFFFGFRP
jgi:hypothetical protein